MLLCHLPAIGQLSFGVHPPSRKSCRASWLPHSEQISVLLSARDSAPGYAPGVSLFGTQPRHRGQTFGTFTSALHLHELLADARTELARALAVEMPARRAHVRPRAHAGSRIDNSRRRAADVAVGNARHVSFGPVLCHVLVSSCEDYYNFFRLLRLPEVDLDAAGSRPVLEPRDRVVHLLEASLDCVARGRDLHGEDVRLLLTGFGDVSGDCCDLASFHVDYYNFFSSSTNARSRTPFCSVLETECLSIGSFVEFGHSYSS